MNNDYANDIRNDTEEHAYELPDGQSITIGILVDIMYQKLFQSINITKW